MLRTIRLLELHSCFLSVWPLFNEILVSPYSYSSTGEVSAGVL